MLPLEILVDGTPISLQAKSPSRQRWKERVAQAAKCAMPIGTSPVKGEVTVSITCFYVAETPDVDNIIKPIQDALNGVVYDDDSQVAHTESRKSRIDGAFRIIGITEELAIRLTKGRDFVRIVVSEGPKHEVLR